MVAVTGEARWVGIGTAFVVGIADEGRTALMFTVVHNIKGATTLDPYVRRAAHSSIPPDFALSSEQPCLGSTKVYVLTKNNTPAPMSYAWWRGDSDVAFLSATLPNDANDRFDMRLPIDTRPQILNGTPVIAIGFSQLEAGFAEPPDYEAERFRVTVRTLFDVRAGSVVRTLQASDQGTHDGLGLLVTCAIDSGMSGGPIIEERENRIIVRAVASRDLSTDTNAKSGSGDHAFVGLFLPALAIKASMLTAGVASDAEIECPTVLDLIRTGVIEDVGRAHEWVRLVG